MSENTDSRRDGRGSTRGGGPNVPHEGFGSQQAFQPEFGGSWRSQIPGPQASGISQEAYNNLYFNGGFNPFTSNYRDSIAAIWSRTSPSGEGVPFSGSYGQFPDSSPGQFAANSNPGQFAANLTGHFAATSELGMFNNPGGEYSAYGQQYGYGPQYSQWPDGSGRGGYSYLGGVQGSGEDMQCHGDRERVNEIHHGIENMKLGMKGKGDSNGYQSQQQPKKMSWANVASQPAKPQPSASKTKKPGVLPPPTIIPSKPPVQLASSPSDKMSVPPPMATPMMIKESSPGATPTTPPLMQASIPPPNMAPITFNNNKNNHDGKPSNSNSTTVTPSNQGPRATKVTATANGMGVGNGAPPTGPPTKCPVLEDLRSVNEYNPKSFELNPKIARFFVIKSFSEDDIHRSIKYQIWCSTDHGNKRLDAAFRAMNNKGPIYLFFSVNGSGHFCGVAEMLTPVDYNSTGSVWVQDKFKGQFTVKWIYVKDVPNGQLRHIRLENNENKPVTNSRDTQEVPVEKGKMVLKVIHSYKHTTSIFDDFVHYEKRQKEEEFNKKANSVTIPGMNLKNEHHGGHVGHREDHHGGHHREGVRHPRGGGMAGGGGHVKGGPPPVRN